MDENINKKRIYIFVILVIIITWALESSIVISKQKYGSPLSLLVLSGVMLVPAITSIITRLITKEGFKDMYIRPRFKKNIKYYFIAYFMTTLLVILGAVIYFIIFSDKLDLNLTALSNIIKSSGMNLDAKSYFILQLVTAIFIGPIVNIVFTLGEELGWRGYLLPKLCNEFSITKSIMISSIIWGVWHAPAIAMGHNYGTNYNGSPFLGIFAMIGCCIVLGFYLSYLAIKTKSAIPCAIAHSALNASAGIGIVLLREPANPFIGPAPTGIIGGSAFILVAIYCYIKLKDSKDEFKEKNI